jgi:hypothetical protein
MSVSFLLVAMIIVAKEAEMIVVKEEVATEIVAMIAEVAMIVVEAMIVEVATEIVAVAVIVMILLKKDADSLAKKINLRAKLIQFSP